MLFVFATCSNHITFDFTETGDSFLTGVGLQSLIQATYEGEITQNQIDLGIEFSGSGAILIPLAETLLDSAGTIIYLRGYYSSTQEKSYFFRTEYSNFLEVYCSDEIIITEYMGESCPTSFTCPDEKWFMLGVLLSFPHSGSIQLANLHVQLLIQNEQILENTFCFALNGYSITANENIILGENYNGIMNSFEILIQLEDGEQLNISSDVFCSEKCKEDSLCMGISSERSLCTECDGELLLYDSYDLEIGKCVAFWESLFIFNSENAVANTGNSSVVASLKGDYEVIEYTGLSFSGNEVLLLDPTNLELTDNSISFHIIAYFEDIENTFYLVESLECCNLFDVYVEEGILKVNWLNDFESTYSVQANKWVEIIISAQNIHFSGYIEICVKYEDSLQWEQFQTDSSQNSITASIAEDSSLLIGRNLVGKLNRVQINTPSLQQQLTPSLLCDSLCVENSICLDSSEYGCLYCEEGYYMEQNTGKSGGGVCKSCHWLCNSCFGESNEECYSCQDNSFISYEDYKCECISGYYYNDTTVGCKACHSSCEECYGGQQNNCLSCKEEEYWVLIGSSCECKTGYIANNSVCVLVSQIEDDFPYWWIILGIVGLLIILLIIFLMLKKRKNQSNLYNQQNAKLSAKESGKKENLAQEKGGKTEIPLTTKSKVSKLPSPSPKQKIQLYSETPDLVSKKNPHNPSKKKIKHITKFGKKKSTPNKVKTAKKNLKRIINTRSSLMPTIKEEKHEVGKDEDLGSNKKTLSQPSPISISREPSSLNFEKKIQDILQFDKESESNGLQPLIPDKSKTSPFMSSCKDPEYPLEDFEPSNFTLELQFGGTTESGI